MIPFVRTVNAPVVIESLSYRETNVAAVGKLHSPLRSKFTISRTEVTILLASIIFSNRRSNHCIDSYYYNFYAETVDIFKRKLKTLL